MLRIIQPHASQNRHILLRQRAKHSPRGDHLICNPCPARGVIDIIAFNHAHLQLVGFGDQAEIGGPGAARQDGFSAEGTPVRGDEADQALPGERHCCGGLSVILLRERLLWTFDDEGSVGYMN